MAPEIGQPEPLPKEPSTYSERLSYAISLLRLPKHKRVPAAAEAIGMTPEGLYIVLKDRTGKRTLTTVNNARVARFCQVDPFWLATGEGSPRPRSLSTEALEVAELFDTLGAEQRKKFWLLLQVVRPAMSDADVEKHLPAPPGHDDDDSTRPGQPRLSKSRVD
jgi:hypothetical protein